MNKLKFVIAALLFANLIACSSDDDAPAQSAAGQAFASAMTAVGELSNLSPAPVTATSLVTLTPRTTGLTAIWSSTSLGFMDERTDVATSMKEYMGLQFQENAVRQDNGSAINVFGRIRNAGAIICTMANALSAPTSAELVATGSQTVAFDATLISYMISSCGFAEADTQGLPESVIMTFSSPSPATTFDLKISMSLAGEDMEMFAKWGASDNIIAFAGNEDNTNGRTRTVVIYNSSTGDLKAEYLSKSKSNGYCMELDRLWKEEATGIARVFSAKDCNYPSATNTSPTNTLRYIVDGNVDDSAYANLSLGIEFSGYASGNGTYEACVQKSDGVSTDVSTVTSNQFTCSGTGGTGGRATGYASASIADFTTESTQSTPTWHLFTTAPSISWTSPDNMVTALIE